MLSALRFQGVSQSFGSRVIIESLNLEITAQAVTAVVGASGCGKSTLLKLCNGLLRPDAGTVEALGEPIDYQELTALRRRMGYAVQGSALFPHLSIRDNIALGAEISGWKPDAIDLRIEELMSLMHLDATLLPRFPHQLSGGQQQRASLCRSMILRPDVLLLDEPFAAIDPLTRYDIHRELLAILKVEPATVLLVTHDMREALFLAEYIVVMHDGRIQQHASTRALCEQWPELAPEQLLRKLMQDDGV